MPIVENLLTAGLELGRGGVGPAAMQAFLARSLLESTALVEQHELELVSDDWCKEKPHEHYLLCGVERGRGGFGIIVIHKFRIWVMFESFSASGIEFNWP